MTRYFILNEATLAAVAWRYLLRRSTIIVSVEAFLPHLQEPLLRLATKLAGRDVRLHTSTLLHYHAEQAGFASATAPWIESRFEFARHEHMPIYGYAYKKACHKYATRRGNAVYKARELASDIGSQPVTGADSDFSELYGTAFPGSSLRAAEGKVITSLWSLALLALTFLSGVAAIARRLRWRVVQRPCFLAADRLVDPRDQCTIDEIRHRGRKVLYVVRSPDMRDDLRLAGIPDDLLVDRGSGRIPVSAAQGMLRDFVNDWWQLAVLAWRLNPRLAFELTSLAYHRVIIRADLISYPCRYFYARDEYNTEHILRTQELRRSGAESFGVMHGVPILGRDAFAWAYVSFDIFFVSGAWILDEFGSRWPTEMKVRPAGCLGFTRARLRALPAVTQRPNHILFFVSWVPNLDLVEQMIDRVCLEYPDRTIWMKVKHAWRERPALDALRRRVSRHANLRDTEEPSLDLLARGRCAISPPSTVVSEALQAGLPVLCIDDNSWAHHLCFRSFPIVVATPEDLMRRLHALDGGDYPYDEVTALVPRDGSNLEDEFFHALGLETAEAHGKVLETA